MKKALLFAALYVAFAAGATATCLFGRAGLGSYRALDGYASALRRNITELESLNAELSSRLDRLRSDEEAVRLLARQLGYLEQGERRVNMPTYAPERDSPRVGHVEQAPPGLQAERPPLETLYLLPLIALFLALCVEGSRARDDG
jgi:hypothetical protein